MTAKQEATVKNILEALETRQEGLAQDVEAIANGDNVELKVGESWPTIRVGKSGGMSLVEVRTYPKADVVTMVQGDVLLAAQIARDAKKAGVKEEEVTLAVA